jgi:hypothetical protein
MIRDYWCSIAMKLAFPILDALASKTFKECFVEKENKKACLEAFSRVLLGIAPWLELSYESDSKILSELARQAIDSATDPTSQDYLFYTDHDQIIVDSALFAQALLRAPTQLWELLPTHAKRNTLNVFKATRVIQPHDNNWMLFPSMIEAFIHSIGGQIDEKRLTQGLEMHSKWYCGDGVYGDGEEFHSDYYNSFVIHPMLIEILEVVKDRFEEFHCKQCRRFQRWAVIQERSISPQGTFPPLGRSLTYRCGAFHGLALCAYRNQLPNPLSPSQVRVALTKVIKATLGCPPNTFRNGWLTIGLYGEQPKLAEPYINHGSVYMCATVLLPLGLPPDDPFWNGPEVPTTWESIENGAEVVRDRPYVECIRKKGRCT